MLAFTIICGPDQICPHLLKEGAEFIALSLAKLFNKSLSDGVLPRDWVSANITPVFKIGDKQQVSNYQPISLTCILCKVRFLKKLFIVSYTPCLNLIKCWMINSLASGSNVLLLLFNDSHT